MEMKWVECMFFLLLLLYIHGGGGGLTHSVSLNSKVVQIIFPVFFSAGARERLARRFCESTSSGTIVLTKQVSHDDL